MQKQDQSLVVGVFHDRGLAERAVDELKSAGFNEDQIGFAVRGNQGGGATIARSEDAGSGENPVGGLASGAVSGGLIGGLIGAAASLLIPGIGPILAGGILAAALTGAAVGAAAGGLIGALTSMGVPEEEAQYYESEFQAGRIIVTVRADGRMQEAASILRTNGANDANARADATGTGAVSTTSGYTAYDTAQPERIAKMATDRVDSDRNSDEQYAGSQSGNDQYAAQGYTDEEARSLQIREEQLQATKQPVQTGEVSIRKDVVTEEKTITVPVTREQVYVEQRNVSPQVADTPIANDGETIRVPVVEEQVQVTKQPVVTGEVVIGKQQVQENRQYTDTVRREEAHIEREGDIDVQGDQTGQYSDRR